MDPTNVNALCSEAERQAERLEKTIYTLTKTQNEIAKADFT